MPISEFTNVSKIYKAAKNPYEWQSYLQVIAEKLRNNPPVEAVNKEYDTGKYQNQLEKVIQSANMGLAVSAMIQLQYVDAHKRATCQRVKTIVDQFNEAALRRINNADAKNTIMEITERMVKNLENTT